MNFFFRAVDCILDFQVTGVQTCALPILARNKCRHRLFLVKLICAMNRLIYPLVFSVLFFSTVAGCVAQDRGSQSRIDEQVKKFLEKSSGTWQDLNVPSEDGQVLHDLIVKNNYRSALEIGTSTGHSPVWIAWALSKTGGKLTTIEIDAARQKQAMENVREAGLSDF